MSCSIKLLNTFSIDIRVKKIIIIHDESSLYRFWKQYNDQGYFVLILGEGSNILFLENYKGIVLLNRIRGISIIENKKEWILHVGAGEKWSELVIYTINKNIPGLENLACIPGCVGAAPINNIGAYGVELSQICEYVDVLELKNGRRIRFSWNDCYFRYRESIFKNNLYKYAVIFVGLKLYKLWKPILHYPELCYLNMRLVTCQQVLKVITVIRQRKLPNPVVTGNAGSFFKNPIINAQEAFSLCRRYSDMPYYLQSDGTIKLSAGWLIEYCKLKGYTLGEVSVYYKQALVFINNRQKATGTEVAALALYVYDRVVSKFNICLQPEVRLIGSLGELKPKKLFEI